MVPKAAASPPARGAASPRLLSSDTGADGVAAVAATAGPGPAVAPPSGPPSGGVTAASAALRGADAAAGAGADPAAAPSSDHAGVDPLLLQVITGIIADGIAEAFAARDARGVIPARAARAGSNSSSYSSGSEPDARDMLTTEELRLVVQDYGYIQHQKDNTHYLAVVARHDLENCPQFRGLSNYSPYAKCTDSGRVEPGSIGKGLMHIESLAYDLRNVNLVFFSLLGQLQQEGQERSVFFEGLTQCANSVDQLDHLVNLERSLNVYRADAVGQPADSYKKGLAKHLTAVSEKDINVLGNIEEGLQRQTEYFAKVVNRSECNLLAKNAANNDGGGGGRSRSEPKPKDKQRGARGGSGKHGAGSERHSSPPRGDRRDSNQRESRGRPSANNGGYASDDSRGRDRRPRREQQRDPRDARGKTGRGDGGARCGGDRHKGQRETHHRGAESDASGSNSAGAGH